MQPQHPYELVGKDVVTVPGQNLNSHELRLIHGLAEGETPQRLAHTLGIQVSDLGMVESSIKRKLGAHTKPQMIARAFVLGVVRVRTLTATALALALIGSSVLFHWLDHAQPTPAQPDEMASTKRTALDYDTMAGGSNGPVNQDKRATELLSRRRH